MKNNRVVYNACYGGFGISYECWLRIKSYGQIPEEVEESIERSIDDYLDLHKNSFATFDKDTYEFKGWFDQIPETICIKLTKEFIEKHPEAVRRLIPIYPPYPFEINRTSPSLLRAIDEIGLERCSGPCAKLAIKEISGECYKINEYDGFEEVIEGYNDWKSIHNTNDYV